MLFVDLINFFIKKQKNKGIKALLVESIFEKIFLSGEQVELKGINSEWLEKLKSRCDIVSVLSRYIRLEKKGKTYWSCCPFHHEKTPSFAINEVEQYYHCFGCKESGDVIKFVQMYESVDFLDAVQILADSAQMEVPSFSNNEEIFALKQKKNTVKEILDLTNERYMQSLHLPEAKIAQDYITKRKISSDSVNKFQIGYSKSWNDLPDFLRKKGYTFEQMKEAGVVEIRQEGNGAYDVMGERLTFPIFNSSEQVIGFSARILVPSDYAKYKNTAQTVVFNKSKAIFGINHIKKLKQQGKLKRVVIVEGQIDVIAMHQAGFEETIACLGTALTKEHARELKRFADKIILCFDGDSAGISATNRTIEVLKEFDFDISIASLPEKKDPDEFIDSYGKDAMTKLLDEAKPVIDFKLSSSAKAFDMQKPDQRSKFIKIALDIISELQTFSQKQVYLQTIKNLSGVPVDVLMRDLNMETKSEKIKNAQAPPVVYQDAENSSVKAVKFVLASLIEKMPWAKMEYIEEDYFTNPNFKKIFEFILKRTKSGQGFKKSDIYNIVDAQEDENIKDVLYYNFDEIGNNAKQYFMDSLWIYAEQKLKEKQNKLNEEYKKSTSDITRKEILIELSKIIKQLKNKRLED